MQPNRSVLSQTVAMQQDAVADSLHNIAVRSLDEDVSEAVQFHDVQEDRKHDTKLEHL